MKRLGITGGIGSGKSYIANMLRDELRVPVYDCDARAKCLNEEDPQIREALTELVGPEVYRDGRLVKPVLAAYLFQDESHAAQVNAIVHPATATDLICWADERADAQH